MILKKRKRKRREDNGRGEGVGDMQDNKNDTGTSELLNTPRSVNETNITSATWLKDTSVRLYIFFFLNQPIKWAKMYFISFLSFTKSNYHKIIVETASKTI